MPIEYPECVNLEDRIVVGKNNNQKGRIRVICPDCGQGRYVEYGAMNQQLKKGKFTGLCHICRTRRMGKRNSELNRGEKNGKWKGGRHIDSDGYVWWTIQPNHLFICMADSRNRVLEHRLVMAEHLGRPLLKDEHVHHIDGNRSNNRVDNLALMTNANHQRFENLLRCGKIKRKEVFNYV